MWLIAVGISGRVVLLTPEQMRLPFAELEMLAKRIGPVFTGASDTLEDAEFLARMSWARWVLSDAPAAVALRSSHQASLMDSVQPATRDPEITS